LPGETFIYRSCKIYNSKLSVRGQKLTLVGRENEQYFSKTLIPATRVEG
jgi:hypothetical protein